MLSIYKPTFLSRVIPLLTSERRNDVFAISANSDNFIALWEVTDGPPLVYWVVAGCLSSTRFLFRADTQLSRSSAVCLQAQAISSVYRPLSGCHQIWTITQCYSYGFFFNQGML